MKEAHPNKRTKSITHYCLILFLLGVLGVAACVVNTGAILDLLASSISSFAGATTTVYFMPYGDDTLSVGSTTSIDVDINSKTSINALGATISFPRDALEIISISKEKSFFDLWTEDTSIAEDSGEIHFSGGTTKQGGLTGTGTVLTLMVRAKISGPAEILFKNVQVYPSDETGKEVETRTRSLSYTIEDAHIAQAVKSTSGAGSAPTRNNPNPDLNGDGKINLVDVSILVFKMLESYNPRYDLNSNGSVGIDDLSILLSKM